MEKIHKHTGTDGSPKLEARDSLENAPQSALTTKSSASLSSGGTAVLSNTDSSIITNMRTRIDELETKLQKLGLLN